MSHRDVRYEVRVHQVGVTNPTDGTVDYVLTALAEPPRFGGQLIQPTSGGAGSAPWELQLVDLNGAVTSRLANPEGRLHQLGRVAEVRQAINGAPHTRTRVGRITGLGESASGKYRMQVSDERWIERRVSFFDQADTTQLYPPGLRYPFRTIPVTAEKATIQVLEVNGSRKRLQLTSPWGLSGDIIQWIRDDVADDPDPERTDDLGNFVHLRLEAEGTNLEVIRFGNAQDVLSTLDQVDPDRGVNMTVWVADPGGALPGAVGARFKGALWAPTAPPSPTLPLHVGVHDPTHSLGYIGNGWALVEKLYLAKGIRIDAAQFALLKASPHYPRPGWRLTEVPSDDLASWLQRKWYGPIGAVPFVNDDGEISPRAVRMPDADPSSDAYLDLPNAFEFNASNLAAPPLWDALASEVVNVVRARWVYLKYAYLTGGVAGQSVASRARPSLPWSAADLIVEEQRSAEWQYPESVNALGEQPAEYDLSGLSPGGESANPFFPQGLFEADHLSRMLAWLRRELWDRWGSGAPRGRLLARPDAEDGQGRTPEDLEPGTFVLVNLASFPNPATNARGGTRLVQLLNKVPSPRGLAFDFVDAGPSLQPLQTPSVSVVANPTDPRHAIDVTISGVPAGASAKVEVGFGAASDFPRKFQGKANGTFTIRGLPSGTDHRVRVQAHAPQRIRSAWSAVSQVTTQALAAPTIVGGATVSGWTMELEFTPAEPGYSIMPVMRLGTSGPFFEQLTRPLEPSSTLYAFRGESSSALYEIGVQHVDPFGGASPVAAVQATTAAGARQLAEPRRIQVLQGRPETGDLDLPPSELSIGNGVEIGWHPTEPHAGVLLEVSTDPAFATLEQIVRVEPGSVRGFVFTPLDGQTRHVRPYHAQEGYDDSTAAPVVSAKPTALLGAAVPDSFAGGYARLTERSDFTIGMSAGDGGDPSTDRVYYEYEVNPVDEDAPLTVDETSPFLDREAGDLPFSDALDDPSNPGNPLPSANGLVVVLEAAFWNRERGFGQRTRDVLKVGGLKPLDVRLSHFARRPLQPSVFTTGSMKFSAGFATGSDVDQVRIEYSYPDSLPSSPHAVSEEVPPDQEYIGPPGANQMTMPALFAITLTGIDAQGNEGEPFVERIIGDPSKVLFGTQPGPGIPFEAAGIGGGPYAAYEKYDGTAGFPHPRAGIVPLPAVDLGSLSGSWTPDLTSASVFRASLTGALSVQLPTNVPPNGSAWFFEALFETNGHTVTLVGGYEGPNGSTAGPNWAQLSAREFAGQALGFLTGW